MKKTILITFLLLTTFLLAACGNGNKFTDISNEELSTMLENKSDYQFIDVRTKDEYYEEHIPGFTINIDYYQFENSVSYLEDAIETFSLDKTKPVVIMCNSGNRSVEASIAFYNQGFTEVYNLKTGIEGWNN